MTTIGCIIARTASRRLPNKVLRKIKGKMLIEYIIKKMQRVKNLDEIYLCTSVDENDKILLDIASKNDIKSYAGSRKSPIDRMLNVAKMENAENVVRITGDNIFTDEIFLERMIEEHNIDTSIEYTRTEYLALGVTAEVIKLDALKRCYNMIDPAKSEYLLLYMYNPDEFNCQVLIPEKYLRTEFYTLTVDTIEDFKRTQYIINKLYHNDRIFYDDIIKLSKKDKIPNFIMDENALLRMPDNETITYGNFRNRLIRDRIEKSKKIVLEEGFYATKKTI